MFHQKNNMQQSRNRKNTKQGVNDNQQIEKQLNDDFEVFEYLKQNKLESGNIDAYVRLYNNLQVQKKTKKNKLQSMKLNYEKIFKGKLQQSKLIEQAVSWGGTKQNFTKDYEQIQINTSNEMEVRHILMQQIAQTKKSLNLLKGDIGHLVSRNQSAKILSSKISKVKIVAQDQYKRVNLAFSKDKEEIKLRNQMQKKFGKKMKNMSVIQSAGLNRMKKQYIESIQNKNQIYQKLNHFQRIGSSIDQYSDLEKIKDKKCVQNIKLFEYLWRITQLIKKFSVDKENEEFLNAKKLVRSIKNFELLLRLSNQFDQSVNSNEKEQYFYQNRQQLSSQITEQKLMKYTQDIMKEFDKLKTSIKMKTQLYNLALKEKEEKISTIEKLYRQQEELTQSIDEQLSHRFFIPYHEIESFNEKVKYFRKMLNSYLLLIAFFDRNEQYHNNKKFRLSYDSFDKDMLSKIQHFPGRKHQYINHFYEMIKMLTKNSQQYNHNDFLFEENFYQSIKKDFNCWINSFKKQISFQNQSSCYFKNSNIEKKSDYQTLFLKHMKNKSNNSLEGSQDNKKNQIKASEEELISKYTSKHEQNTNTDKNVPSNHQNSEIKAQRIQLLQEIDRNYAKMIKSTLKMEKQNTRKNYQFLRNFKRAKYSSRDAILQEKRFEGSFSVLFSQAKTIDKNLECSIIRKQKSTKTTQSLFKNEKQNNKFESKTQNQSKLNLKEQFRNKITQVNHKKQRFQVKRAKTSQQKRSNDDQRKSKLKTKLRQALNYT